MRRGDLITVAIPGDFGKPRPALVVQSDLFDQTATATVMLLSSTLVEASLLRPTVQPSTGNGLRKPSQVMIDKIMTVRRERIGKAIGHLEDDAMAAVTRALTVFLDLA